MHINKEQDHLNRLLQLEKYLQETTNTTADPLLAITVFEKCSQEEWERIQKQHKLHQWIGLSLKEQHSFQEIQSIFKNISSLAECSLENLKNTSHIAHCINMEMQRVERGAGEFSILAFNLSIKDSSIKTSFKELQILIESILRSSIRAYDSLFLLEEKRLVLVLPGASAYNARLFAKRFLQSTTSLLEKEHQFAIALHIGVATYKSGVVLLPEKMLDFALEALEEALVKNDSVLQISSHLLGEIDRESIVREDEKTFLFAPSKGKSYE